MKNIVLVLSIIIGVCLITLIFAWFVYHCIDILLKIMLLLIAFYILFCF